MILVFIVLYVLAHSVPPVAFAVSAMAVASAHPVLTAILLIFGA